MYSGHLLYRGVYSIDDLPQTISFQYASDMQEFILTLQNPPSEQGETGIFDVYYVGDDPENQYIVGPSAFNVLWIFSRGLIFPYNGGGGEPLGAVEHLISNLRPSIPFYQNLANDTFANSYTVTACSYAPVIGTTLTRKALCNWQGTYLDPVKGLQLVQIYYCANEEFNPYDYPGELVERNEYSGCNQFSGVETVNFFASFTRDGEKLVATKTPHFNTPAGNYAGDMTITFA